MSKSLFAVAVVMALVLISCGGGQVDEAASGTISGKIEESQLGPGKTAQATFDLSSGSYVLLCTVPGHYGEGMSAPLQVSADAAPTASVQVALGEWFIRPTADAVAAGSVTFEAHNQGGSSHNLVILRTDLPHDALVVK
jgi:hypothetical protein